MPTKLQSDDDDQNQNLNRPFYDTRRRVLTTQDHTRTDSENNPNDCPTENNPNDCPTSKSLWIPIATPNIRLRFELRNQNDIIPNIGDDKSAELRQPV